MSCLSENLNERIDSLSLIPETLVTHKKTYNCFVENNCIPCLYKLCPSGYFPCPSFTSIIKEKINAGENIKDYIQVKLPHNQRPEMCPRTRSSIQSNQFLNYYSTNQNILTVGDGDLSFSLSLAKYLVSLQGHAKNLTATTHESYSSVCSTYPQGLSHINELKSYQVQLIHEVDATHFKATSYFTNKNLKHFYDVIIWNFPCVRVEKGADGQVTELDLNKKLLKEFFLNSKYFLKKEAKVTDDVKQEDETDDLSSYEGEIHIAHKTIEPFSWWKIKELALESDFFCPFSITFDKCLYPGYVNRKVLDKKSFPCNDAQLYLFLQLNKKLNKNKNLDKFNKIKAKYDENITFFLDSVYYEKLHNKISNLSCLSSGQVKSSKRKLDQVLHE